MQGHKILVKIEVAPLRSNKGILIHVISFAVAILPLSFCGLRNSLIWFYFMGINGRFCGQT